MNVRRVSCLSGQSVGYEVRMADLEEPLGPLRISRVDSLKKKNCSGGRRNSYSLNHIELLKASSLAVPGYEAANSTRSLSALSSVSKSNLNLNAKSAIDMLKKSYSRLFASRSKLSTSCHNFEDYKVSSFCV